MNQNISLIALPALFSFQTLNAQEMVIAAKDPETLFTSKDPVLHKNKQTAYLLSEIYWKRTIGNLPTNILPKDIFNITLTLQMVSRQLSIFLPKY